MSRVFTADYVEHATLRDGTRVLLRLVTPDDKELLKRGFDGWSHASRYARFFVPKQRLTDDELAYLCEVDQESHFALGAVREGDGEPRGLGIARFIRLADVEDAPVTAEAAIAVSDEMQGKGLGRLLFQRLVDAAGERGIAQFRCEVAGRGGQLARDTGETEREQGVGVDAKRLIVATGWIGIARAKAARRRVGTEANATVGGQRAHHGRRGAEIDEHLRIAAR